MTKFSVSWIGAVASIMCLPTTAIAQSLNPVLDAARVRGDVGEQLDGYVGIRNSAAGLQDLIAALNSKRRELYTIMAPKMGYTPTAAAAYFGCQNQLKLRAGEFYKTEAGNWQRTAADDPVQLPDSCPQKKGDEYREIYARAGLEGSTRKAADAATARAKAGDIKAMLELGAMKRRYRRDEAMVWYRQAAGRNNPAALDGLARLLLGDPGGADATAIAEALTLHRRAAALKYVPSMENLASMYHYGRYVPKDEKEAFRWYSEAAALGSYSAQRKLAEIAKGK